MANEFVARKGIISNGDIALRNRITIGGSSGTATTGAGFWTDYITGGKTSLGALSVANGYGIFYYQGGAGRDGNDSIDFAFNTTTAATSVMSVKTNGEVKISGAVTATNFIGNWNGYTYSASSGANTMVQRDGSGYIQNNYFSTSAGGAERNASGMGYFTGFNPSDYYIRSYTAAAAATLLSGQTMNIVGTATTATQVINTVAGTGEINLVYASMADNDQFRIRVGGVATNAGWVELATADDGNEPIYVRQYTGIFTTLTRTATLLDGSGNTSFPGSLTIAGNAVIATNGYISTNWFNSNRGDETTTAASYIYDSGDGYFRKKTLANTKTEIVTSAAVIAGLGYTPSSGGVTGTGTTNYITKWTGTTTIGHCNNIYADATNVSIGGPNSISLSATYVSIGQSVSMNLSIGQGGGGSMSCFIPTYIYSTLYVTGDVVSYYSSDKRLKDNITKISNALEKITKIGGYSFDWNDKQKIYHGPDIGVIAQEIETVLPEIVTTRSNGYKAVNYEKIVALLIEGIKEQQIQIDKLNSKLLI